MSLQGYTQKPAVTTLVEDEVQDKKKVIREHKTEIGERLYSILVNMVFTS